MIQDPRIGRRGPKGRIVQAPTKYVSGEGYTPAANPAPTVFWLDKNQEYYVILPVSMSRIKPETHAMFLKIVGKEDQIDFPYNDGNDDVQKVVVRQIGLGSNNDNSDNDEEEDNDYEPPKRSAAEINADRRAKLLAELAMMDEMGEVEAEASLPKKTVKVVKSEMPTFQLPSFNKKSSATIVDEDDSEVDAKTQSGIGLVPKPQNPKNLKSTLKSDQTSGTNPKKSNLVN